MLPVTIKKVAHITFDMCIGGAEQVVINLVENTDPSRFNVSILCLEGQIGPFGMQLAKKGFTVKSFGRRSGLDFRLVKSLRRYFIDNEIEVIHCHQYTPYIYGLFASLLLPIKVVFTEHGRFYPDERRLKRVLVNPILSLLTDHITAISAATADALEEFENFPSNKIDIVYNGIDDRRFQLPSSLSLRKKLGIPEEAFVLATVARLDRIKNQELMIRALHEILKINQDIYLLVVGDGPERERLETLSADLQLTSHVIFAGFRQDTPCYYKIMDLFLLTSFSEGTAMTLLEAMANGIPCIGTDVGGNPEIILDQETGFIIADNDQGALVKAIMKLYQDRNLLCQMGQASRRRYENLFTVDKMVQSYEKLYS